MKKIILSNKLFTLVDDDNFVYLNKFKWHFNLKGYAYRWISGKKDKAIYLHREIMNPSKGMIVDHKNDNGLDNQKSNLRICTYSQNAARKKVGKNRKYKGIYFNKPYKKWLAQIWYRGKNHHIGSFIKPEDAVKAFTNEAIKRHGEFIRIQTL